jgi:glycosyltransferase involved in cell wall biosynthesis
MQWLALTWFDHRRTTELCEGLGIELRSVTTRRRGFLRYLELTLRTLPILARARPKVLLVQNPSLILAVLTALVRPLFGYRLVVDAHNEAVEPYINRSRLVLGFTRWVLRRADLTIVTNRYLAQTVVAAGGTPFVLPDRIPRPLQHERKQLAGSFRLLLIATFAPDEPLDAVIEAVRDTPYALYVTGNHKKAPPQLLAQAPANVTFTGFLSEADYWAHLAGCDAVVDLTTMPNCLVCGGYEAAALSKPLLLTHSPAAVDLFGDAAVFTDNSMADIRRALEQLRANAADLAARMQRRHHELNREWRTSADSLGAALSAPVVASQV